MLFLLKNFEQFPTKVSHCACRLKGVVSDNRFGRDEMLCSLYITALLTAYTTSGAFLDVHTLISKFSLIASSVKGRLICPHTLFQIRYDYAFSARGWSCAERFPLSSSEDVTCRDYWFFLIPLELWGSINIIIFFSRVADLDGAEKCWNKQNQSLRNPRARCVYSGSVGTRWNWWITSIPPVFDGFGRMGLSW